MDVAKFINKMMALNHWKSVLKNNNYSINGIYLGKIDNFLIFEAKQKIGKDDFKINEITEFQVFLPQAMLKGKGLCVKVISKKNEFNIDITRILVFPKNMIVSQHRHFKRFFIYEKAILVTANQEIKVIVKDLSFSGMGVLSSERILNEEANIFFNKKDLYLKVKKIHEFTDFSFFQYGMTLIDEDTKHKYDLAKYLENINRTLNSQGIDL